MNHATLQLQINALTEAVNELTEICLAQNKQIGDLGERVKVDTGWTWKRHRNNILKSGESLDQILNTLKTKD